MYAPRVFVSMLAVLLVFGVTSYAMNGSIWTALFQTFLCAVLIQVGYFVGILYLIRREKLQAKQSPGSESLILRAAEHEKRDEIRTNAAHNFPARDR